jgi:hypothetical protein
MDLIKVRFFALHLRLSICLCVCLWASDRATSFPLLLLLLPRLPRKVPRYFSHLRSLSRSRKLITASAPMLSTFLSMGPIPHFASPALSLLFHHLGLPFPSSPLPFPSLPFPSSPFRQHSTPLSNSNTPQKFHSNGDRLKPLQRAQAQGQALRAAADAHEARDGSVFAFLFYAEVC